MYTDYVGNGLENFEENMMDILSSATKCDEHSQITSDDAYSAEVILKFCTIFSII